MSGRPATHWLRFRFVTLPVWLRLLVLPALALRWLLFHRLLARVAGTSASGRLPVCRRWWLIHLTLRWGGPLLFIAGLVLFGRALLVPLTETEALLGWSLAVLCMAALTRWVVWPALRPRAIVREFGAGRWVELRAHPLFVAAVRARSGDQPLKR